MTNKRESWECTRCQRMNAPWSARCDCFVTAEGAVSWPEKTPATPRTITIAPDIKIVPRDDGTPDWFRPAEAPSKWVLRCTCGETGGRENCPIHNPPHTFFHVSC
jgi:hypothetical protein